MKRVGVREFKDNATALINEEKGLVIEKHGKPVGFYIPLVRKDKEKAKEAAARLEHTIEAILERTGMTREELVEFFTKDWEQSPPGARCATNSSGVSNSWCAVAGSRRNSPPH